MKRNIIKIVCVCLFFSFSSEVMAFGVITDIHAGKGRIRRNLSPKAPDYPKKAVKNFKKALKSLKERGENIVFVLGDNTEKSNNFYAKKLKKIVKQSGLKIFWVKGNHDANRSVLMLENYYFEDIEGRRIVVLDTNEVPGTVGGVSKKQLDWLKEVLKTEKKVIILQHHPVFNFDTNQVAPQMEALKEVEESENVEFVLSGHWHLPKQTAFDKFNMFPPISVGYSIIK